MSSLGYERLHFDVTTSGYWDGMMAEGHNWGVQVQNSYTAHETNTILIYFDPEAFVDNAIVEAVKDW